MKEKPYILVVDDDPNIAKLEQLYLEKAGYEVKTVGRGDDAMTEFRKMPPDLMLLDVMMPGMDGWQVLKAVRKSSNIPIIMVTARDETFDKVLGLELGADDYITKPFDSKEMAARVKAVLRRTMGQTEEEEEKALIRFPSKAQRIFPAGKGALFFRKAKRLSAPSARVFPGRNFSEAGRALQPIKAEKSLIKM